MARAKPKAAYIFWVPDADPTKHRARMSLDSVDMVVVAVRNYDQAVEVSKELVKEGAGVIELCSGFGNIGVARVAEAVKGVPVGVVKFDMTPTLWGKTGDQVLGLTP